MKYFSNTFDEITKQILRPVRSTYTQHDLGPVTQQVRSPKYDRKDMVIQNNKKQNLQVSFYIPRDTPNYNTCLIYLHSLNGSRLEAFKNLNEVLNQSYLYVTFDFSGSGKSEGNIVTYGAKEVFDLDAILYYILQNYFQISNIILWGRSLGSVIALLYMQQFSLASRINALILDSPFTNLKQIVENMAASKSNLPKFILSGLISLVSSQVEQQGGFQMSKIEVLSQIKRVTVPAIFITSKRDTIVPSEMTESIYKEYTGNKKLFYARGEHNTVRDSLLIYEIIKWIQDNLPKKKQTMGSKIKNKIIKEKREEQNIPIRQVDLNSREFRNMNQQKDKQRANTYDSKLVANDLSPQRGDENRKYYQKIQDQKYQELVRSQRSLYQLQECNSGKLNSSYDFKINKTKKKLEFKNVVKQAQCPYQMEKVQ